MADTEGTAATEHGHEGETRRDFLQLATGAFGAVGLAAVAWPFIQQMNPAADTLASSSTEVNLEPIKPGQRVLIKWRGKPVFIVRRTKAQIDEARAVKLADLVSLTV